MTYNDGGREAAGYKGHTGDCVTRAISIATGIPYQQVYDRINELAAEERPRGRRKRSSARTGVQKPTWKRLLAELGWVKVSCMGIGTGCKVHLTPAELPSGTLIVQVSRHLTVMIDGVVHDTHDPSRDGERCVYSYWKRP